ncbi:Ig-like domain-containing protein [Pseudahrensia aquimaris]|uniref:Ig-like domain-containing protein n=1 Tax=Pseudahrensia aquimaris TaxID=744461 RepID=A0ABW3FHG0_9HYPH
MTILMVAVNDAPVANDDAVTTPEEVAVALNPTLPGDVDDLTTVLTVTVDQLPNATTQGTISYTPDGGGAAVTLALGDTISVAELATTLFTPATDFNGTATSFAYTVSDDGGASDTGSVAITVTPVNDAPDAASDARDVDEDGATPLNITLPTDVDDVPADLSVIITQAPLAGEGTITYTPDAGGADVTLAPGDTLTLTELASASFTPATNYTGPVTSLSYTAQDDELAADAGSLGTVDITIVPINDAPDANDDAVTTNEDTPVALNPTLPSDVDDATADLTVTITQVPNGTTQGTVSYTDAGGATQTLALGDALTVTEFATLSFAPVADYDGLVDTITYTVTDDDNLSDAGSNGSIMITLVPVNDAPDAFNDVVAADEDTVTPLNITLPSDVDDVPADLSVIITQAPLAGEGTITYTPDAGGADVTLAPGDTLTLTELASASFTPATNYTGPVTSLSYTAQDDELAADAGSLGTVDITIVPINDAPDANDDAVTTNEDTPVALNPTLPSDVDDATADLTVTITQVPNGTTQGTVSYTDAGGATQTLALGDALTVTEFATLSFAPVADYDGLVDTITYTVTDDDNLSDAGSNGSIMITLVPVNDAPDAFNDVVAADEDTVTPLNITLPSDVDDVPADLSVIITQAPLAGEGTITYTPDGGGADVTLAPGDTLTLTELASASFTPATNYTGPVTSLSYTAQDDEFAADAGSLGTVDITIVPINDAPDANDDAVTTNEDTPVALNPTLPSDVDDATADLTVTITQVPNGTTQGTVSYTDAGGATQTLALGDALTVTEFATLSFAPVADYDGLVDTITYTVTDDDNLSDAGSNGSIMITLVPVNDAPDAFNDVVAADEDTVTPLNITLPSDVDDVPADLSVIITQAPLAGEGTITYTPDAGGADVTLAPGDTLTLTELASASFTPATNYTGPVTSLSYTAQDDELAADAGSLGTVDITIVPINDAPDANDDAVTTNEDTPVALNPTLPSDVDDATADLTVTITQVPNATTQGTVSYTDAGGATQTLALGDALTVTEFATLSFAPVADYDGLVDTITYTVTDDDNLSDAGSNGSIMITLVPVNDAPESTDETLTTLEDTALDLNLAPPTDVEDADADLAITVTQVPDVAQGEITFQPNGNGTPTTLAANDVLTSAELQTLTFVPTANYAGPVDSLLYTVSDSDGGTVDTTVALSVTPVNDAPAGADNTIILAEDNVHTFTLGDFGFSDVDDNPANALQRIMIASLPDNGALTLAGTPVTLDQMILPGQLSQLVFTPEPNANNDTTPGDNYASFDFVLIDDGGTANGGINTDPVANTITFSVTPINDLPTFAAPPQTDIEDSTVTGDVQALDADGDALDISLGASPLNGVATINPDGTWTYAPNADWNGTDTFDIIIDDGNGVRVTVQQTVIITPGPDIADDTVTTDEDVPITINVITGENTDGGLGGPGADDFEGTPVVTAVTQGFNGSVFFTAQGEVVYTPDPEFSGTDSFTYTVTVNGVSEMATVTVLVNEVNDPPRGIAPPATTLEDTPIGGGIVMIDPEGDIATATLLTPPPNGDVVVLPNGSWTYTPVPDFNGFDSFIVMISDPGGASSAVVVDITVLPVDDVPQLGVPLPPVDLVDGETVTLDLTPGFDDPDTPLTYTAVGLPPSLALDPATGIVTGTLPPNASQSGPYTVTVTATDGINPELSTTFEINVTNPPPVVVRPIVETLFEDQAYTLPAGTLFDDPDGDTLTFSAPDRPDWVAIDPSTGEMRIAVPIGAQANGPYVFDLIADDGEGGIATTTVTINIQVRSDFIDRTDNPADTPREIVPDMPTRNNATPPFIVEAINEFQDLNGTSNLSPVEGIVSDAVNRAASLDSVMSAKPADPEVLKAVDGIEELRSIDLSVDPMSREDGNSWAVEGLTGFSVRFDYKDDGSDADDAINSSSREGQLVIETYVRERVLFIDVNNTFDPEREGMVKRYLVEMLDGSPVPEWIRIIRDGFIVAERPANILDLELKVSAEMESGELISRAVRIHGPSGEIQPLALSAAAALSTEGARGSFSDMLSTLAKEVPPSGETCEMPLDEKMSVTGRNTEALNNMLGTMKEREQAVDKEAESKRELRPQLRGALDDAS